MLPPSSTAISIGDCSPLNTHLHREFLELVQSLSPQSVPSLDTVMNTHKLLARLTHSDSLAPFCELCQISEDTGSEFLWRCFAFVEEHAKDEDQLFLVFTPCFFSVLESSPVDTSPLGLPVVLLRTSLSVLLGPEPLTPLHTPPLPDTTIKTLFSSPIPSLDNSSLIAKLRHLHSKAFLRAAHTALTQDLPLPPSALTDALHHCDRAQLSVFIEHQ